MKINRVYLKTTTILLFTVIWVYGNNAFAQFELKGEFRPRTELRHGYKTLPSTGANAAFFTEQRSRAILGYSNEFYELGFSVQDVRIWGDQGQLNKSDGLLSIHEAWGLVNFNETASLKAGRQELVYDDHRILGNVGWTAQGRSHDVLLFMISGDEWSLHTGVAFNQDSDPPESAKLYDTYYSGVQNYKTLQYVWYHRKLENTKISLLVLNNGIQQPDSSVNFTQTMGLTGSRLISDFRVNGTVYYQTGKDPADLDLNALLASLSISYSGFANSSLALGVDYLSGTGVNQEENHSFNPLYGTHHKFYGLMDYFYVGNPHSQPAAGHNNNVGLVDLYLKSTIKPSAESSITTAVHQFLSPVTIVDPVNPSRNMASSFGTEIDLAFSHELYENVKIQAGYSHLFATPAMEIIKGGNKGQVTNWAWVMLSINPVFLSM